jgi:hypothetical protein
MISVNTPLFDFYFGHKISRAISIIRGIVNHLYGNNPFLELKQSWMPNNTSCSTNSTAELLHDGVRRAELQKLKWSSLKHPLYRSLLATDGH